MEAATLPGLPNAALHRICALLEHARDVAALCAVCRALRGAATDEGLWRALCARDFELDAARTPSGDVAPSYRHVVARGAAQSVRRCA